MVCSRRGFLYEQIVGREEEGKKVLQGFVGGAAKRREMQSKKKRKGRKEVTKKKGRKSQHILVLALMDTKTAYRDARNLHQ